MKTINLMIALPALLVLGCKDDDSTNPTPNDLTMAVDMAKAGSTDMAQPPAMPALGDQIERMGRPTINVAVTNPFDLAQSMGRKQDAIRNAYNIDADPTKWVANWQVDIRGNLAIYDALDADCGSQFGADKTKTDPTRYNLLSSVLADDRLWMDTGKVSCNFYLALEAAAVGMTTATECGGRNPNLDVVDETYTLATVGTAGILMGGASFMITDGIGKDADGTASLTVFPFLGPPL